jgi:acyl dehydratase
MTTQKAAGALDHGLLRLALAMTMMERTLSQLSLRGVKRRSNPSSI